MQAKYEMDRLSVTARSLHMSRIRSKNTAPEIAVRKLVFSMGYRYRLHWTKLPGKPDLFFSRKRKVIFVHGCFWHRHQDCRKATTPKSNTEYWLPKFKRTIDRDRQSVDALTVLGWNVLIVWECELKDMGALADKLRSFLNDEVQPTGPL